jgi:hypothetical protein
MGENYLILGLGVLVILLSASRTAPGPRGGPYPPMTKTLRIALITYGVLIIVWAVASMLWES